ncbi:MAG: hypothetical protein AAF628_24795 [Planctomycetota bacterium]
MIRAGAILSVLALAILVVAYSSRATELEQHSVELGRARVDRIAAELDRVLLSVETATREFAAELESGAINTGNLLERLERDSYREPFLLGLTVAYGRDAYPGGDKPLYAPFFDVASGQMVYCEEFYDYTDPKRREDALWYQDALNAFDRGSWVAAFGPAAGTTYVGYSLPFRDAARQTAGIVNASVSMAKLNDLLNRRFVGRLGGGVMVNQGGMLICHPVFEHVRAGRNLGDVADRDGDAALHSLASGLPDSDAPQPFEVLPSFRVDGGGWLYARAVARNGWRLGVAIFENELDRSTEELRRRRIVIGLTALFASAFSLLWLLRVDRLQDGPMWLFVIAIALLCLLLIGAIWSWTLEEGGRTEGFAATSASERAIADATGLAEFLEERRARAAELREPEPVRIPTGIEVQALRFEDGETVQVGGIVWQIYDDVEHEGLDRIVGFANLTPDAEALSLEETIRRREGTTERIVWQFRATLRVRFDYSLYPFDRQRVPIVLDHPAVDRNVVLTPDLDRYAVLNTRAKPGLAELVLPGWTVLGSFFGYRVAHSTVGFGESAGRSAVPQMHFDVLVQRQVLTPFISHIVPLLIVAALLHGVLISSSFNADKKSNSGFSTFGVLETSGAFFFAIVFMHIDLRGSLSLDTITYLEALYIVAYSMLILVAVNAMVFTETDAVALLEYRDNLVAKLAYWPILAGLCLAVTIWMFY